MPGEKIVVGTMSVKEGSTPIEQRYEGFVNAIAGAGLEYEVAARGYGYTQDVALQVVGDMLTANPDINVVWCDCEGSAIGAVMAVKAAGLQDQVKVFCIDVSEQICDLLMEENPVLLAAAGQDGYAMGYDGMMLCPARRARHRGESHRRQLHRSPPVHGGKPRGSRRIQGLAAGACRLTQTRPKWMEMARIARAISDKGKR